MQVKTLSTSRYNSTNVSASVVISGTTKAIFGYGYSGASVSMTNLVSNTGTVAIDTTGVGTARYTLAAAGYAAT